MKMETGQTQGSRGWQINSQRWAEEWITGAWGLQIPRRGFSMAFTFFLLPAPTSSSQPSLTLERRSTKSHDARCTSLKTSRSQSLTKGLWNSLSASVTISSPLLHFAPLLFYILSSNTDTLHFLWSLLCLLSHPNVLAAWLLFFSPASPHCVSEGRQQVFCDLRIREPQRNGAPLSSAACVGGGERKSTLPFSESVFFLKIGESGYPTPGQQSHQFNISACVLSMLLYASYRLREGPFFY